MPESTLPILIAGAGCAGLSLAVELQKRGYPGEVIIVDPKTRYGRDRTWCHYLTRRHAFESCISHRWHQWRVRTADGDAVAGSNRFPYVQISSDRFYAEAMSVIASAPNQRLKLGTQVESIELGDDSARVSLSDGSVCRVSAVFDSRPDLTVMDTSQHHVTLYQQFVGLHIRCQNDVFMPETAEMMDFSLSQGDTIRFIYVLPYSTREALIEATLFTKAPIDPLKLEADIPVYMNQIGANARSTIIHREYGCIPMSTARVNARPHPRLIRIGLTGGAAKPSTGYAFGAIQDVSGRLADELSAGIPPSMVSSPHYRRRSSTFLDDVFLCYIARHPSKAAEIFRGIFKHCSGDRIARFLTDTGTIVDDLFIISAMPKIPFILEALLSFRIWSSSLESETCPGSLKYCSADARSVRLDAYMPTLH